MDKLLRSRRVVIAGVLGLIALSWLTGKGGQETPARAAGRAKAAKAEPTRSFFGVGNCMPCHEEGQKLTPDVCRCDEITRWKEKDKHAYAYLVLEGPQGQAMQKRLNENPSNSKKWTVTKDEQCLSCHGVIADPAASDPKFHVEEGVNCVACHGAYLEWVGMHSQTIEAARRKWQALSRDDKEKQFGMKDLWNPVKRAELCTSCHVGNHEEGKVVTHEMYAAGHPPLPSFELAAYSGQMRHWELLREKKEKALKLLKIDLAETKFEETKLVQAGSAVALRAAMNLLAKQADAGAKDPHSGKAWPELAQFECYACHHELKVNGWRPTRGFPGIPGRPHGRDWPIGLVRLEDKGIDEQLKSVYAAFDVQPFGDPAKVRDAAQVAAKWASQLLEQNAKPLSRADAVALMQKLCVVDEKQPPDFDTARQLAWALKTVYEELKQEKKPANDADISAILGAFERDLMLKLPAGKGERVEKQLPATLDKLNNYTPGPFQESLKKLAGLLPKE
jgi:hypothetical protein